MGTMQFNNILCRNGAIKTFEDVRIEGNRRIVERFGYVPNDTITIQRGPMSITVDANDPKVKELLAYLSGMLV